MREVVLVKYGSPVVDSATCPITARAPRTGGVPFIIKPLDVPTSGTLVSPGRTYYPT
jgi:hypothetical protein